MCQPLMRFVVWYIYEVLRRRGPTKNIDKRKRLSERCRIRHTDCHSLLSLSVASGKQLQAGRGDILTSRGGSILGSAEDRTPTVDELGTRLRAAMESIEDAMSESLAVAKQAVVR